MEKEFNLSKHLKCVKHTLPVTCEWVYPEENVKEAVRRLKDKIERKTKLNAWARAFVIEEIDEIFGEEIAKSE